MGLIKKQGIRGSIAIYLGIIIGAFNSIYLFPKVFSDSPESMGLIQLIINYSLVIGSFVGAGFPNGIIYFFPQFNQDEREKFFGFALIFSGILVLLGFIAIFIFPSSIASQITNNGSISEPYLIHLLILVILYVIFELIAAAMQNSRLVVFPAFLKDVGRKLAITLLLLATHLKIIVGLDQFMLGLLLMYAILTLWLLTQFISKVGIKLKFGTKGLDYKKITVYSFTVMITIFLFHFTARIDTIMLGSMMETTAHVAFYSIAYQIGSVVWTPAKALNAAIRPVLAENLAKNNIENVRKVYSQSASNQFFLSGFIFVLIVVNLDFIYAIIPKEYNSGQNVVWFIASGFLFNAMFGPSGLIINFTKAFKLDFYLNAIMLFVIIALNYWLIPIYGVLGAAASTAFTTSLYNIVKNIIVYRMYRIIPIRNKTAYLIIIIIGVSILHVLIPTFGLWQDLVLKSTLLTVLFAILLFKTKLAEELRETMLKLPILNKF